MAERNYCECCDASRFLNEKKLCRNCADRIEAEHIKFRAALEKNMPCDSSFKFIGTCVKRMPKYDNLWCPNCRARKAILDKMTVIIPRNSFQTKKVKT